MDQYDLFGGTPPHVRVNTSIEAARKIKSVATKKAREILHLVKDRSSTCFELEGVTGWPHQTVSARLRELELKGLVRKTNTKRRTQGKASGRVYESIPAMETNLRIV
jgi:predicted Rossmann fold nucleotide-binding protein DprA/Smf involved in DNA uptake